MAIANVAPAKEGQSGAKPFSFMQSTLFQWVNPKGWIMATSAIAAYTSSDSEIFVQVLFMAFVFFLWFCLAPLPGFILAVA